MLDGDGNLYTALSQFFASVADNRLWEEQETGHRSLPTADLAVFFEMVREPLHDVRATTFTNPWVVAGLGHDEVRICSVLASLWDINRYGTEAVSFLARFLDASTEKRGFAVDLNEGYRIQLEHCLNGAVKDRVDITIETRTAIIGIEVKVYASERDNQLFDYSEAITRRAELMRRKHHQIVFLSPYSSRNTDHDVPHISWRQLSDLAAMSDHTNRSGWLINQFGEFCRKLGN
ncbi:MAG: PD-(D/E)XK nuclease family protein [Nitrobacter sp.]|uniref:PD-(D/E)XK nuclease family protein n=1 Tax=Nitrobacter sp. TaxID=29420 RepID=UPI0026042851|nr:PD-(D/E)XK nuclease family protein [Nitrobacter sp.]MCV0386103.1 PD-(D/E)XK nuclease family protein [Nitrobacter sp.]